jgi:signal transduction histidine kinase/CheY-like chemotaxis protein
MNLGKDDHSIREIYEATLIRKNKSEVPIEIAASKTSWHGKTADMLFFRDITDRQRVEEEIQKMQKLESIGILAGGIAHDFNNRISIILGNAQVARIVSEQKGDISKYLRNIEEGTEQAKALTQQLLTFSMGGAPIKKVASIAEILRKSARFSLSGSNVKCNYSIPVDIWPVEIDLGQIDQVIGNIIINADQAMPEGGTIQISVENVEIQAGEKTPLSKGRYVKVMIKDSGIGIQKKHLKKIFDPYYTTKSKGSGLGLTIAYSVIKNHGGLITAESSISKGTTFVIYLPASDKKLPEQEEKEYKPGLGKGRILVMDDEELVREMAGDMLKSLGYQVGYAGDGIEAIEAYRQSMERGKPYDAVLMDLTIPGSMGGKEAVKELKKIDPNVKVIVSSGYSNDPIMAEYNKYGFSGVIAKPYKIKDCDETLASVLNKQSK